MADQKVSDLPSLSGADVDAADLLYIIDSSAGSAGSKKITVGQYQLAPVSAGTANGVMYLDGSKVVTTGSDLVFDGANLGVGTSSPGATLETVAPGTALYFSGGDSAGARRLQFNATTTTNTGDTQNINALGSTGVLAFSTNSSERARITSGGDLLVGTTATSGGRATVSAVANYGDLATGYSLVLANTAGTGSNANPLNTGVIQFGNPTLTNSDMGRLSVVQESPGAGTQSSMRFFTNGGGGNAQTLERARITSGGDLLVGTTSNTPANTTDVAFCAGSTAGYGSTWQQIPNNAPASYKAFTVFRGNVEIGSISYNGTGVNFNATSDRRLKENIAPAGDAGAVIDAIDIVQHDWKAGGHTRFGVIAQDLNEVAPEAVTAGDDNEEIERTWGVDYSKLVPMLIKEIQTLRARVAALESA